MNLERALYRRFWLPFYRWYALRYVQHRRVWKSHGLTLEVPPGVFHPGIYFSTPFFLDYLEKLDFKDKIVLDIGTGSGALAVFAAKKGAVVHAVDINPLSVETAQRNAMASDVQISIVKSDLFQALAPVKADYILVNPPYYPRDPANDAERAFYAGTGLSYFNRFFEEVIPFCLDRTAILMILSEDCNWPAIQNFGTQSGFRDTIVAEKKHWGERLFVAEFRKKSTAQELQRNSALVLS